MIGEPTQCSCQTVASPWLDPKKKPPELFKEVLVLLAGRKYQIAIRWADGWFDAHNAFLQLKNVTHWTPLPEPPP